MTNVFQALRTPHFLWLAFSWLTSTSLALAQTTGKPASALPRLPDDPALAPYGLYQNTAPGPIPAAPTDTALPLVLHKGNRIAFVGNTLLERAQDFGHLESALHLGCPQDELVIRHLAWSADEVDLQPRPENFASLFQHLTHEKIDIIIAAFGFNESFGGLEKLDSFKDRLTKWVQSVKGSAFNGKCSPQLVLLSPTACENLPGIPAADLNNANIEAYTFAMEEVCNAQNVAFIDLFHFTSGKTFPDNPLTINGVHLTKFGDALVSERVYRGLFQSSPPAPNEALREAVVDKNAQYFRRYRPLNSFYYTGGRRKDYGYLDFLPAMRNFDLLTANRDRRIWDLAQGKVSTPSAIDDSNLPALEAVSNARGANEWLDPEQEKKAFRVDNRFDVNLFASEEQFPDLAKPIQMRWDNKGRLWVACSTTYPHVYPGGEPSDKVIILEDTDHDGKADKCTVWADHLHIPLSFELTKRGIYVSEQPYLTLIEDTTGEGRANHREKILAGFGTEDSHHALHDLVWTPDGDLLMRESIFHHSQVETAYGPVRLQNSGWFQFTPFSQRLTTFGSYPSTNPWGVTFDDWGNHVGSHPIFANAFHATNPPYPQQHPPAGKLPAYSGTCGQEFIDFPNWPSELQGCFIKARYKPTNKIELHQWIESDDHFEEKFISDLLFSENLSFIPVDLAFSPRGELFLCDWYNPIKGHAQYSLRDPRRDRTSGRIWRITPKGAPLPPAPVVAGASVEALLAQLKRPEYRLRYLAKRELRERGAAEVAAALDHWVSGLDTKDPRYRHHQVEALWMFRGLGEARPNLLTELLNCEEHHARAAAARMLRHWHDQFVDGGASALAKAAADPVGLVRLEAVISASYVGSRAAFDAVMPVMHSPMSDHLRYAVVTAFGSEKLRHQWEQDAAMSLMVNAFLKKSTRSDKMLLDRKPHNPEEIAFDAGKDVATIEIATIPERMLFTPNEFTVKRAQQVKLVISNPDLMQHNFLIVQPGALEEVGVAANEMAKDPGGILKNFIPPSDKILQATKLLDPNTGTVLRFTAPNEPGIYPFVCTFPGHWVIMNGKMIVQ